MEDKRGQSDKMLSPEERVRINDELIQDSLNEMIGRFIAHDASPEEKDALKPRIFELAQRIYDKHSSGGG